MGITGLLPFLEKASSTYHLRDLRGKCVAIDSYCWLHRGAFGCAERLARGETTDLHIQYCLKYVQLLLSYNIKPILVFDGRHLPAKAATESKRRESRENARKRGAELLRLGRTEEARSYLRRCIDITPDMALQLIQECRRWNVDCIVAPYEADAQLAFLNRADIAQYVITEDSDLVLFGCNRILFKLDLTGNCRMVDASKLHLAMGCREERFQFAKFRYMCILSGCDYLDSLPGIGLAKACRFVLKTEDPDIRRALAKIPSYLNMRQLSVSEAYKDEFLKADATFKHMVVYDPVQRRQTRLLDPDEEGTPEAYCCNAGEFLDENTAFNLALGNLDPFSLRQMDDWHPDAADEVDGEPARKRRYPSIWKKNYKALVEEKQMVRQCSSKQKTASMTTFVKRPPPNAYFEEQGTKDTICDVLQAYGIQSNEPPLKRLCYTQTAQSSILSSVAIEYEDVNALETMALLEQQPTTPKRNRNPFVMATTSGGSVTCRNSPNADLLSPTKITPENRSLLQNISPVKRIDYSQQRQGSIAATTTTSRLSRFTRANTTATTGGSNNGGQKVISRFFCTQQTKVQMASTLKSTTNAENPESYKTGTDSGALHESPTAIVKAIKSKRSQMLEATALYLQSPEAQRSNRGERTPEKGTNPHLACTDDKRSQLDRFDSGIAMGEKDRAEDDNPMEEPNSSDGLSSSQKENDGTSMFEPESECTSPRVRGSVRLALFERHHGKKIGEVNCIENDPEELAIVIDDNDDVDAIDMGQKEELTQPNPSASRKPKEPETMKSAAVGVKNVKSKASCRRPGLSTTRKQSSKGDNGGLTQSRLSMFGFQKKSSMQLGNQ
ncbi:exonuclease 1 [Anopheles ziemanni]|uniref:exonuclease 1 n=1 Tax=Anopheles coustani TaxID=139045 RepID=UPI00265A1A4F|nr:exonuclease 1 [Anopheles coustani]XP_058169588.1 exonuclease 1 [Anopheles ziemanni]